MKSARCYVDGSFNPEIGKYAFGCVMIHDSGNIEEYCGSGNDPEALLQRNVAGEMIASMLAVKWAVKNGYDNLTIYYDYKGIECWVTGEWKAKNELTQKYRDWMRAKSDQIEIGFVKVAAHTNDTFNEAADKLAKAGLKKECGIPQI